MSEQTIHFFTEDVSFRLKDKTRLRKWLKQAAAAENHRLRQICYIFCSDTYLLKINRSFLDHDTLTDIITFDHSAEPGRLAGDIYISIERLTENAEKFAVSKEDELHRVMIHGILHLCGYKDKTREQKALMRTKEDLYISLYKSMAV